MGRPLSKHIDEQELNALVPSSARQRQRAGGPLLVSMLAAARHVASCAECERKVAQYRQLIEGTNVSTWEIHEPQPGCPADVDWHDVAAGLWPELRTQQLITHAARCTHCGPLLRAASADEPTPEEAKFLAQLKAPPRPVMQPEQAPTRVAQHPPLRRQLWNWKVLAPAAALIVLVALLSASRLSSAPLSGGDLAQFALETHQQHFQGKMALDLHSDSQRLLNEWLHQKADFPLVLPASADTPREGLPYRLEGARMVKIHDKTAAYIAYRMEANNSASLIVTPVSAAVATGGVEAAFNKVTFHYYTIQNHKVVTWSVHGLTYALVSEEGNKSQRSCMVCHSAMRDRDLSDTPTPLADQKSMAEPVWQ